MGYIIKLLVTACRKNKLIPVLFIASAVARLYYVMFSTFWILYLTSFVGTILDDDEQVSKLYANLMLCSVTAGLAFSPLVGIFTDKVSPRVTIPVSFLIRATGIGLFYFIKDPTHVYAFAVGTLMVVGTTSE